MNNFNPKKIKEESIISLTDKLNAANQKIVELERANSNLKLRIETLYTKIRKRVKEELRIDHTKANGIEQALEEVKPSSEFTVQRFRAYIAKLRGEL